MRRRKQPHNHFYKTIDLHTLRGVMDYNPDTGDLRFKAPDNPDGMNAAIVDYATDRAGDEAATGCMGDRRRGVLICGVVFSAVRLIWAMQHGVWPCQVFIRDNHESLAINNIFASRRNVPRSRIVEFTP